MQIEQLSIEKHESQAVRILISTATEMCSVPQYHHFLCSVGATLPKLIMHPVGAFVCSHMMFKAPGYCQLTIRQITCSPDWLFEKNVNCIERFTIPAVKYVYFKLMIRLYLIFMFLFLVI